MRAIIGIKWGTSKSGFPFERGLADLPPIHAQNFENLLFCRMTPQPKS